MLFSGRLPEGLRSDPDFVASLWGLHPTDYHEIRIRGRKVKTPRWEQAYERTYSYVGSMNEALPLPELLRPHWSWVRSVIDPRLNGLLLNWYDAKNRHYIGKHRDKTKPLVPGAPIVTISFGAARTFRLRPHRGTGFTDFRVNSGTVMVLPFETNRFWTHEVPHLTGDEGRRVSLTVRAFVDDADD